MRVPVVDRYNRPLMPTKPSRARKWIASKKATPFWKKGIFCVRLNVDPSDIKTQPIAVGVDPGSKTEALTVKSKKCTHINIQTSAITHVKDALQTRREMRRGRRFRKTPCRTPKLKSKNEAGFLPPSTKARWHWKLRIINHLRKIFPISDYIVEDIAAETRPGARRWNANFSPIQTGKKWFYDALSKLGKLTTKQGFETAALRHQLGLTKSKSNPQAFAAHCVDSWALANSIVGGHTQPDNTSILYVQALRYHRRQLHKLQPAKGGIRRREGGTTSLGLKRGSLVKHPKHGLVYVGGNKDDRISLHHLQDGRRLTQTAKPGDCKFVGYNSWRWM